MMPSWYVQYLTVDVMKALMSAVHNAYWEIDSLSHDGQKNIVHNIMWNKHYLFCYG